MTRSDPPAAPEPSDRRRLASFANGLALYRQHLRWVDYPQAEHDAGLLATALRREIGPEALATARFRAIPRGGLIVLGLLAYQLGLDAGQLDHDSGQLAPGGGQLDPGSGAEGLLVLVDDCALSGLRLRQALARASSSRVVAAHLYSTPALRRAAVEREPHLAACVAAHDLEDLTPRLAETAEEQAAWRRRWAERLGDDRYWTGVPELVAFAWSEPDRVLWNPESGRMESGWHLAAPHRCLNHRIELAGEPVAAAAGGWRLAPEVAWGRFDGVVWLCHTGRGQVFSLAATAADLWAWLVASGSAEYAVERALGAYDAEEEAVRRDLAELTATLQAEGLLEPPEGSA